MSDEEKKRPADSGKESSSGKAEKLINRIGDSQKDMEQIRKGSEIPLRPKTKPSDKSSE
jgi:hypothetical protein